MAAEAVYSEDVEMADAAPAALEKGKGREAGLSTLALDARPSSLSSRRAQANLTP